MIITHLAVSGVGRFRTRHIVRGLGPGLNLLCAPNEAGKSTIFRALRAGLFYRHTSGDSEVKSLGSAGAQLPAVVELGFERAGVRYALNKSFLFRKAAMLAKNDVPFAEAREADEAVWATLGLSPGSRAADESTFGLLWVEQGASFEAPQPNESAQSLLNRMIEAEVGQVLGGSRGERVRAALDEELAAEETERDRRPRTGGAWKTKIDAVADLEARLKETQAMLDALDADFALLRDALDRQQTLDDPLVIAGMQHNLALARAEADAANDARRRADEAAAKAGHLKARLDLAERDHADTIAVDRRIAEARARLAELEAQSVAAEAAYAAAAESARHHLAEAARLADELAAVEAEQDRLVRLTSVAAEAKRAAELRERLHRAREIRDRIAVIAAALAAEDVSAAVLQKLEALAREVEAKEAQRAAKAPRVAVRVKDAGRGQVRVDGSAVEADADLAAVEAVTIEVGALATIEVMPVEAPADSAAVEQARAAFARALQGAGVSSLAEARHRRARGEELAIERRGRAAELAAIAPAARGEDGIAALERALATAEAAVAAASAEGCAPLTEDGATARLAALREQRMKLRAAHEQSQSALASMQAAAAAEARSLRGIADNVRRLRAALDDDLARFPDDARGAGLAARAEAVRAARSAFDAAQADAAAVSAAVPSAEALGALEARIRRLTSAIESSASERQRNAQEIIRLRERIATRGGEGLGERKAALEDELALAKRELARTERHVKALRLLRDTIEDCRREAREAYLAPVKAAARPFLHALFPQAEALLDERLGISGLQREGEEEAFALLSHGTREQIAVVVRLALGRLLAKRGHGVPIVLDDALVYSDDERIERMFDALALAAEDQQVIVLTCRTRAFQSFGGRRLRIEREDAG